MAKMFGNQIPMLKVMDLTNPGGPLASKTPTPDANGLTQTPVAGPVAAAPATLTPADDEAKRRNRPVMPTGTILGGNADTMGGS